MAKRPLETDEEAHRRRMRETHEAAQNIRQAIRDARVAHEEMMKAATEFGNEYIDSLRKAMEEAVEPLLGAAKGEAVRLIVENVVGGMMQRAFDIQITRVETADGVGYGLRVHEDEHVRNAEVRYQPPRIGRIEHRRPR